MFSCFCLLTKSATAVATASVIDPAFRNSCLYFDPDPAEASFVATAVRQRAELGWQRARIRPMWESSGDTSAFSYVFDERTAVAPIAQVARSRRFLLCCRPTRRVECSHEKPELVGCIPETPHSFYDAREHFRV